MKTSTRHFALQHVAQMDMSTSGCFVLKLSRYLHYGALVGKERTSVLRKTKSAYKESQRKKNSKQKSSKPFPVVQKVPKAKLTPQVRAISKRSRTQPLGTSTCTSSHQVNRGKARSLPRKEVNIKRIRARKLVLNSSHSKCSEASDEQLMQAPGVAVKSSRRIKTGSALVINRIAAERMLLYKDSECYNI